MSSTTVKIIELDVPSNRTGRVYTTAVIRQAINMLPTDCSLYAAADCTLETPPSSTVLLENITHLVSNLRIENNWLIADVKPLNTPKYQELSATGAEFIFNLAGIGTIHDGNIVKDYTITHLRSSI